MFNTKYPLQDIEPDSFFSSASSPNIQNNISSIFSQTISDALLNDSHYCKEILLSISSSSPDYESLINLKHDLIDHKIYKNFNVEIKDFAYNRLTLKDSPFFKNDFLRLKIAGNVINIQSFFDHLYENYSCITTSGEDCLSHTDAILNDENKNFQIKIPSHKSSEFFKLFDIIKDDYIKSTYLFNLSITNSSFLFFKFIKLNSKLKKLISKTILSKYIYDNFYISAKSKKGLIDLFAFDLDNVIKNLNV